MCSSTPTCSRYLSPCLYPRVRPDTRKGGGHEPLPMRFPIRLPAAGLLPGVNSHQSPRLASSTPLNTPAHPYLVATPSRRSLNVATAQDLPTETPPPRLTRIIVG